MAARSFDSGDRGVQGVHPVAGPSADGAARRPLRSRLIAIAPTSVDAVRYAGGWLFDSVMAGCDVMVLAAEIGDDRPLQILGARAGELETALTSGIRGPRPHILAVDADLCEADRRVRRLVGVSLEQGLTEVLLWSDNWPTSIDGESGSVRHRLSVAARAFKTQALTAAAVPVPGVDTTEVFHSAELLPELPPAPYLVPA